MEYCTYFHGLAVASMPQKEQLKMVRLRCKMWTCEYCAKINRNQWRAKIIHHIQHTGGDWCWFTLTAHSKARGEQKSIANLRNAWDILIKRLKRKHGDFSYARVYEQHKDKSYHIHAIASFNFDDIKWRTSRKTGEKTSYSASLQKTAIELSLGMYTHAANVEGGELHSGYVASYITKYIVKLEPETKSAFGRIRHIQLSQNWIIKPYIKDANVWKRQHGIYIDDVIEAQMYDYTIIDVQENHVVTENDFISTYIYPPEFDIRELLD